MRAWPAHWSDLGGIPGHPIEDVKLSDIVIVHAGGGTQSDAQLLLPEKEKDYPEPTMFGTTPAHGFFIRHVRGLEVHGIKIQTATQMYGRPLLLTMWRERSLGGSRCGYRGLAFLFVA